MEKKPKIYFAASIRGGRDDVELYRELIDYMQTFGKVLTEHIGLGLKPSDVSTTIPLQFPHNLPLCKKNMAATSSYFHCMWKRISSVACRHLSVRQQSTAKIYFAASIRAGRSDAKIYKELIDYIKMYGQVMSECEQLGPNIDQEAKGENDKDDKFIHDRDMAWLDESDVLIAEVTQPSLGVGYEIGRAIERGKTILCLFRPDSGRVLSAMIRGAEGENLQAKDYQGIDEAKRIIRGFLATKNLIR